jgi:CspA family cold shock protein
VRACSETQVCLAFLEGFAYVKSSTFGQTNGLFRLGHHRRAHVFSRPISTTGDRVFPSTRVQCQQKVSPMETGTVKWYNGTKGYGFIQPDNGDKDVFVHATALERAGMRGLREGQKISYELQTDQRTGKASAVNLQNA